MRRYCDCEGWRKNINMVIDPGLLESIKSNGQIPAFCWEPFMFCPWCGDRLQYSNGIKYGDFEKVGRNMAKPDFVWK